MGDLDNIVQNCIIKPEKKIKRIVSPLIEKLPLLGFAYVQFDIEGRYCHIGSSIATLEYFYDFKVYETHPYYKNPLFFRSGYALSPVSANPKIISTYKNRYQFTHYFIICHRLDTTLNFFIFLKENQTKESSFSFFLSHLDLLTKFGQYFKNEAEELINQSLAEGYNIKKVLGKKFDEVDPKVFHLLRKDPLREDLLRLIEPLSPQERKCLEYFKMGHSAQSTAALMGLSQRTVEHYLDNVKIKLKCKSKWELLKW